MAGRRRGGVTIGESTSRPRQPFRPFFVLAALDAVAGILPWLGSGSDLLPEVMSSTAWHRDELIFGMVPAVMAGFLLTALPRWTGASLVSGALQNGLLVLWLAGRMAHLWAPSLSQPLSAGFILCLAATLAVRIASARRMREVKVVTLLVLLASGAVLVDTRSSLLPADAGHRIALAALLGLVAVIGGRITPALTHSFLSLQGKEARPGLPRSVEIAAALALAAALGLWCLQRGPGGAVCLLVAAALQLARLVSWRPWRVARHPGLIALHLAYGWLPIGLCLAAWRGAGLPDVSEAMVVHAWSAGTIGLMCLAVMQSMIRRQTRRAFLNPRGANAALACAALCAPFRLLSDIGGALWLPLAATGWIAAFGIFLTAFRRHLLWR
ncbi:hypothetical protein AE618_13630 [Bosea vaviloviae]|jgi:uncharacterized protein involved in response to NO|uniref:NnrS family protein n=2 Tax=Boseaceae TaxID=2831100 RepID=A0A0N1F3K1_9HYPH|nr:NnrS family protein [Bosea vaviloviae]KPH80364.1 hypothetical protein AE618_13630 [Bosea vaviloviae]